jgi:hypothetical protein
MIGRYESGHALESVEIFGKIAAALGIHEVELNGHRLLVDPRPESSSVPPPQQLKLEFDNEHDYHGTLLEITPTKVVIGITVTPAARMVS